MTHYNLHDGFGSAATAYVHVADYNIWFNLPMIGQISLSIDSIRDLDGFINFLDQANFDTYQEFNKKEFFCTFELPNEGSRNLLITSGILCLIINAKIEVWKGLSKFLMKEFAKGITG